MLNFTFKSFFAFGFIVLALLLPLHTVYSQTGAWISQTISQNMSGTWHYGCGETVAALTRQYSRYIYFFDINSSQWSVVDFGSTQTVRNLAVKGNTAIAYTDSLIVGYSGITSQWDTVYYRGAPLDPDPSWSGNPSWGSGENLAWFVTDSVAYIFDSGLGHWQAFAYSIPFTYQSNFGRFWSRGDYAAIILFDSGLNIYYNLAYSLNTHNFNELPDGGYYQDPDWKLDHGFVGHWDNGSIYKIISYSANGNTFSTITLTTAPSMPTQWLDPDNIIERTVFAFSYSEEISHPIYRLHSLGFDTRMGVWTEETWDYNVADWDFHRWECGGGVAMRTIEEHTTGIYTYLVFSGLSGSFGRYTPGIRWDGVLQGRFLGGTVVTDYDTSAIWFHSVESGATYLYPYLDEDVRNSILSEDFVWVNNSIDDHPDSIHAIYFNESQNTVHDLRIPNIRGDHRSTPYLIAFSTYGSNNEVFFYSGIMNNFSMVNFPSPVQPSQINAEGELAAVKTSDYLTIYDAATNSVHTESYSYYLGPSLGAHVAVIRKGDDIFQAYSTMTHQWYEFTIPDGFSSWAASNYLGRCESLVGNDEFYAFNGFNGNLVMLQAAGNPVSGVNTKMGAKTILVVRDSVIYAFDPGAVTKIQPKGGPEVSRQFLLHQNYPNPFNPETTIRFDIPLLGGVRAGLVTLKIYDILGREVKTLLNEPKPAGSYTVHWDSTNDTGQAVASGVYLYQIKAGEYVQTRKMVLMR